MLNPWILHHLDYVLVGLVVVALLGALVASLPGRH